MSAHQDDITVLLGKVEEDQHARSELFRLVEDELRRIAKKWLRAERPHHTLQATHLVDEAFLRLVPKKGARLRDHKHFYRVAARAIRDMLIDHERARRRKKRGGGNWKRAPIEPDDLGRDGPDYDLLALNEALEKLAGIDSRQVLIVDLHHFAGYTLQETAAILGIERQTAKAEWAAAKAWLYRELSDDEPN